ncbi:MAG: virulence protein RhuM/Fic/DOC family protein [Bacilli bacterium]|mgnify:CR=1 FL=1|nr:virulence protein RhuM/Fic/DOC family protein [Bacilli bacterium]
MNQQNEIILFENQGVKLEVNMKDETVWLSVKQMAELFDREESNIRRHIINIFKEQELIEANNVQNLHVDGVKQKVPFYNLDVIISVGYRVKSQNGVIFRKWATKVLKDVMIKGYAVNQKRLEYLEKTVKLIDIANRIDEKLDNNDAKEILRVIGSYSKALDLLDNYDHRTLLKPKGNNSQKRIKYSECLKIINKLRFNEESDIFAIERNKGLEAIIGNIYQTFDNNDVYQSIEEKASNFLYMIVKNHVFIDGNKRIAATLFIYFLNFYDILYKNGKQVIDNNTLTALTLFIAESNPKEKEVIIDLVMNFLS